ncbi:MAG: PD40 domain-containing protein, partial [Oligoflexia bacterium]|nr:PD40 domain-containing protein [Oligoflexia bacterium]
MKLSKKAIRVMFIASIGGILIVSYSNCSQPSNDQPASQPPQNVLATKINTSAGWSDSPFISRDGQRLYFMYSRYNFAPWILSSGATMPVLTGQDREGLHKSNQPWDESDIYMSTKNSDGTWSTPVNMGFNGAYGDSSGMEFNNGNSFIWLQGNGVGNNIVISHKDINGTWSNPEVLNSNINFISQGVYQDNPHISADGTAIWFVSNRAGGMGGKDIWFSSFSNNTWGAPVNLSAPFNSAGDDDQFWFSPVSSDIYWNSSQGLMHCISNGVGCTAEPTLVKIDGCQFIAEASMPDDGQSIYFACGDLSSGTIKIMHSNKQ